MRKIISLILSLTIIFSLTACAAQPVTDAPYETASDTLYLEAPAADVGDYPAENPPADSSPVLDSGIALNAGLSDSEPANDSAQPANADIADHVAAVRTSKTQEVRAVWISFYEFEEILKGRSKSQFTQSIQRVFDNVKNNGFNSVFVHVRPYADAIYPSQYFPWSYLAAGSEGSDPGFDPLKIMVDEAHSRNLKIEAWINPYRIRAGVAKDEPLSKNNQAVKWRDAKDEAVISYDGCLYYNPASAKARTLIVNGVKEIVQNYDIDGIHFDDYFYPTTSASFDRSSFESYKNGGGTLTLANWRRENVNLLVKAVYKAVKAMDSNVLFGISPQGNNDNNYNQQYIDVKKWLSSDEYIDYICPQVYWGYQHKTAPFKETVESWNKMAKAGNVKLYIGLAPYKFGVTDSWAGDGKNEWQNTTNLMARMAKTSRDQSQYGGIVMFRYMSLFEPQAHVKKQAQTELGNLKKLFQ